MARITTTYDLDAREYIEMTVVDPVATAVEIITPVINWRQRNKVTTEQVQAFWQSHPSVSDRAFTDGVAERMETWPEDHGFGSSDRFWAAFEWTLNVMIHGAVYPCGSIYDVDAAQARQNERDAWAEQAAQYAQEARGE